MSGPTVVAFVATVSVVGGLALVAPNEIAVGAAVIAVLGWLVYWLRP